MQILAQLALIVLCLLMFRVERKYKLAILLLSAICFNCVRIYAIPFGLSTYVLCFSFILSEFSRLKKRHKGSQEYNIKTSNVFCNISNCYIGHT